MYYLHLRSPSRVASLMSSRKTLDLFLREAAKRFEAVPSERPAGWMIWACDSRNVRLSEVRSRAGRTGSIRSRCLHTRACSPHTFPRASCGRLPQASCNLAHPARLGKQPARRRCHQKALHRRDRVQHESIDASSSTPITSDRHGTLDIVQLLNRGRMFTRCTGAHCDAFRGMCWETDVNGFS